MTESRMSRVPLARLVAAYRDATGPGGMAFATPQIALVGAFSLAYGVGLILARGRLADEVPSIAFAMALGLIGLLGGIATGWGRSGTVPTGPATPTSWLPIVGGFLLTVGLASMALYLLRIGELPLFMASVEQGRVDAAERGGAALRVLSLLTLPGCWLIVASAAATRRVGAILVAIAAVLLVAGLQALTANRSPAFQVVIVAVLVAVLAGGLQRLRTRGLVILAALAVGLVVAAGAFGALRLASAPLYGPPSPGQSVVEGPPPDYVKLTFIAIRGYAIVPAQNFAFTLQAVPERIGWRLGYTYLQPLITILPGKQVTFDQDLKVALEQRYAGGGTVPTLLGEAYANFGPFGWLAIPFLIALATAWLYRRAAVRNAPALWALYAFAIFHACGSSLSGLFVASIFPFEAYAILGAVAAAEWKLSHHRTQSAVASSA